MRQSSGNKITIDLFDKELMPVINELYPQSTSIVTGKNREKGEFDLIFDNFACEIESLVSEATTKSESEMLKDDENS